MRWLFRVSQFGCWWMLSPKIRPCWEHLMLVANKVALDLGVGEGFRLVVNNGESVGMTIYHLHLHIMGGRTYAEQSMG